MNSFNRRTAIRIAVVSTLLAAVASPVAWYVARENAEQDMVALAMEDSRRVLRHVGVDKLSGPHADKHAQKAADGLAGGLFDIAEIYDNRGFQLAAAMTEAGQAVEVRLPGHPPPTSDHASYTSFHLPDGQWVWRVFVPFADTSSKFIGPAGGYFEGVRIVSTWQRERMRGNALNSAVMVGIASLLCGLVVYPVVVRLSADNERKAREILDSHLSLLATLGRAIAKRDATTGAHNFRVAWIAARIGENLGLKGRAMESLIAGSFLHDIGKVSTPDHILRKPGPLDAGEQDIMHTHVQQGEDILSGIGWLDDAHGVVAGHHEKWDGSGYPRQLAGEAIPLGARVFAVADVFDALCSRRPYKTGMKFEAAMAEMERGCGTHFDPAVMDTFRPIAREIFERLAACSDEETRRLLEERVRRHFGV